MAFCLDIVWIQRWIDIFMSFHSVSIPVAVGTILVAWKVFDGEAPRCCPCNLRLNSKGILSHDNVEEAHVTPILAPD